MEQEAYRFLGILPAQLYRLTPRQYHNLIQGKEQRMKDKKRQMATHAYMIRIALNKRMLRFEHLVGEKTKNETSSKKKAENAEAKKQEMAYLESRLGMPQ